jgi:hypothetical protein
MSEPKPAESYVTATATPTPDYLRDAEVVVLSRREREFITVWRRNSKASALAVDPAMAKLWNKLCRLYAQARKHDIEPIVVVDMIRLDAYTLNDVE